MALGLQLFYGIDKMLKWLTDNIGLITAIVGLITIFAIFYAPVVALKLQRKIEDHNEKKLRKLGIFKTLLATRANTVSLEHVQALNMIDVEFYGEKNIRESWNIYRDHLNSYPQNSDRATQDRWEEKRADYLTDLLYEMSGFFGYDFDKVILKKGAYSPMAHGMLNLEQAIIRKSFIEFLNGDKAVAVKIMESKKSSEEMLGNR